MYYAIHNAYGSATSMGFANTWRVLAFNDRQGRDAYVADSDSIATKAVTRKEATKYARDAGVYEWDALTGSYQYTGNDVAV